ncbi:hypothetical protein [Sulfuracidifex tepidarius]|nr:hypothetical protein [Sulfuracidifex tepidarius]
MGKEFLLNVSESFNKTNNALTLTLAFTAHSDDITVYPKVKISYYDVESEDMRRIATVNCRAIGYHAGLLFYKTLETSKGGER